MLVGKNNEALELLNFLYDNDTLSMSDHFDVILLPSIVIDILVDMIVPSPLSDFSIRQLEKRGERGFH